MVLLSRVTQHGLVFCSEHDEDQSGDWLRRGVFKGDLKRTNPADFIRKGVGALRNLIQVPCDAEVLFCGIKGDDFLSQWIKSVIAPTERKLTLSGDQRLIAVQNGGCSNNTFGKAQVCSSFTQRLRPLHAPASVCHCGLRKGIPLSAVCSPRRMRAPSSMDVLSFRAASLRATG